MHIHFIIHEAFEGPGAIRQWALKRQYNCTYTHLYAGDALPQHCNDFDMLIVMGGPQSPDMSRQECPHFNSGAEQQLIKMAVDSGKIVLGVCLGAQMISNALGATTTASPFKEIGLYPVTLTEAGKKDALFTDFPEVFDCGHWHGDMPGLTKDAVVLAHSEACPRQIIRFAPKVYAFQCHFEFTPDDIDAMITNCAKELEEEKDAAFVQSVAQLRANDYSGANALLFKLLDQLVKR
ncbi:glutamine amidotransferase-related protein [Carboxylicivirga sp. RSCT41]|uniref:glutamine amidotransferase-related protein n=1 Tax=Carboxylicivirga agarovorans TaxID=3417570 RepID=UPI003D333A7E